MAKQKKKLAEWFRSKILDQAAQQIVAPGENRALPSAVPSANINRSFRLSARVYRQGFAEAIEMITHKKLIDIVKHFQDHRCPDKFKFTVTRFIDIKL
jgi:ribosomal protein S10